ncbi:hypothetical protein [Embleya sp. AB8]|uniref:hypothetical protein n=1 Tax=Embleya sp. AB8 TaxID=3156304 RepID=UPI003C74391E
MTLNIRKKLAAAATAAALATVGGVLTAAPASADPIDCTVHAHGSAGVTSVTLHVDLNPCYHKVVVKVFCWSPLSGDRSATNSSRAFYGDVVADCSWRGQLQHWTWWSEL